MNVENCKESKTHSYYTRSRFTLGTAGTRDKFFDATRWSLTLESEHWRLVDK